ncbi:MAG: FMN-binding protein [Lentisphaeria bacterium]|nr:FMN-binding protein [Lentisphaeria bacterium]
MLEGLIQKESKHRYEFKLKSGKIIVLHKKDIKSIMINGRKIPFNYTKKNSIKKSPKRAKTRPKKSASNTKAAVSKSEINRLIQAAGKSKPDWWNSVNLNYPKSLDLSYPAKPVGKGWNSRLNVNQYMWSIINENPGRFKQGTKFMHFLASKFKTDKSTLKRCYVQLAHCYHDLLQDWARAAYFYEKAGKDGVALSNCYLQLGNKQMAKDILRGKTTDRSRYGALIKQWSVIGDLKMALKIAEQSSKRNAVAAYRAAGDACRYHKQYKKAISYYQKCLKAKSGRDFVIKLNHSQARDSINSISIFETFDLSKIKDGRFTGTAQAYNGNLKVEVTIAQSKISKVKIVQHREKQYYSSLVEMPAKIIKVQSVEVDATTGATVTAEAIKNATAKAIANGRK